VATSTPLPSPCPPSLIMQFPCGYGIQVSNCGILKCLAPWPSPTRPKTDQHGFPSARTRSVLLALDRSLTSKGLTHCSGHFESTFLALTNFGTAQIITGLAVLETAPSLATVKSAVSQALEAYPLLKCHIHTPIEPRPRFAFNKALDADAIVRVAASAPNAPVDIIFAEIEHGNAFDLYGGPLWRVALYESSTAGGYVQLALTMNHVLSDGVGLRNLFGQLLACITASVPFPAAATGQSALPPAIEDTMDVRIPQPSAAPRPPNYWPNPPPAPPNTRPVRAACAQVPAPQLAALKEAGKARGVRTLHPILHVAALCALDGAVRAAGGSAAPVNIRTTTSMSLRAAAAGHPTATGNYVGKYDVDYALHGPTKFWELARTYAAALVSPAVADESRKATGVLAHVPQAREIVAPGRIGLETNFVEPLYASAAPYLASIQLSNLGLMQETLPGVREVAFGQTPGIFGAVMVNVSISRLRQWDYN
jgi:hypothetical protein